jgi:hypothetical protein
MNRQQAPAEQTVINEQVDTKGLFARGEACMLGLFGCVTVSYSASAHQVSGVAGQTEVAFCDTVL